MKIQLLAFAIFHFIETWYNIWHCCHYQRIHILKTHLQVIFLYTNDYFILWIELMNFWWCMMFLLIMNRGNQLPWKICLIQTLLLFLLAAMAHSSFTFPSFPFDKIYFYTILRFFFVSLSQNGPLKLIFVPWVLCWK